MQNSANPLGEHYDEAFNAPEGWLESTWCEKPTMCAATMPCDETADTVNEMSRVHLIQGSADEDIPFADADPSLILAQGPPQSTPAVVIPSGDGLVTIRPEIVATTDPPDAVHDAEAELDADEMAALEAMSTLHEYACEEWMTSVPLGRIGEWVDGEREGDGPPVEWLLLECSLTRPPAC
jgi:hypothetical protein